MHRLIAALRRTIATVDHDERGEVNVSMISWMVVSALVIFAFRTELGNMLTSAVGFVTTTLGI
jgi:hypothetical protein